jgi:hypothetical protein
MVSLTILNMSISITDSVQQATELLLTVTAAHQAPNALKQAVFDRLTAAVPPTWASWRALLSDRQ